MFLKIIFSDRVSLDNNISIYMPGNYLCRHINTNLKNLMINSSENIKPESYSVLGLLIKEEHRAYKIPVYQRSYDWEPKNCAELFSDIEDLAKQERYHYLGNLIAIEIDDYGHEFWIIDGQQRLTSLCLLLCAIRDLSSDIYIKEQIHSLLISDYKVKNDDGKEIEYHDIKLSLSVKDRDVYEALVRGSDSYSFEDSHPLVYNGTTKSNLIENYRKFIALIKGSKLSPEEIYGTLNRLLLVFVKLKGNPGLDEKQRIFEKINATGMVLTYVDLVKNMLLFSDSENQQKDLYKYWQSIEYDIPDKKNFALFIESYINLQLKDDIKTTKLYETFRGKFKGLDDSVKKEVFKEVLKNMKHYAKIFKNLIESKIDIETNERKLKNNITVSLNVINLLDPKNLIPLLMFLISSLKDNDSNQETLSKLLYVLCGYMLRIRIVSPYGGGASVTKFIFGLLKKLSDVSQNYHKSNSIQDNLDNCTEQKVRDFIQEHLIQANLGNCTEKKVKEYLSGPGQDESSMPSETAFKDALTKTPIFKKNYAIACLMLIDYNKYPDNQFFKSGDITLEHLVPQSIKGKAEPRKKKNIKDYNWWINELGGKEAAEQIGKHWLNSIGNLAILAPGDNTKASNFQWSKKIPILESSNISITAAITKEKDDDDKYKYREHFRLEEIHKRADSLAEDAINATWNPEKTNKSQENPNENKDIQENSYNGPDEVCKSFLEYEQSNEIISGKDYEPTRFEIDGKIYNLPEKYWTSLFFCLCSHLYNNDSDGIKFMELVDKNLIHRPSERKDKKGLRPIISEYRDELSKPKDAAPIENSPYFVDLNLSADVILKHSLTLLRYYHLEEKSSFYYRYKI